MRTGCRCSRSFPCLELVASGRGEGQAVVWIPTTPSSSGHSSHSDPGKHSPKVGFVTRLSLLCDRQLTLVCALGHDTKTARVPRRDDS